MKLFINQNDLSKAINIVQKAVSSRTTLPILTGILLEAIDNKLFITATDLDLGIKTSVDCIIEEEGSIVVNSKLIGDFVRKLPSKTTLSIKTNELNNMEIKCTNSDFNILGNSSKEFPDNTFMNEGNTFFIKSNALKNLIKYTTFSCSQDNMKPVFTGCLMEIKNKECVFAALDGFRLAVKKENIDIDTNVKAIIPSKTLVELFRIIEEDEDDIEIVLSATHITFKIKETIIISSLLEGEFINYKDILKDEYITRIKVKTNELKNSIERASLLAREDKDNLIILDVTDKLVKINSTSEYGNVEENIEIEKEGNDLKIGFNSKYILDVLKVLESDEIYLNFVGEVNPCIIKKTDKEDYTYLVLPVRIS